MAPQIWLSIGLLCYYLVFQMYDDFLRLSTKTSANSKILERLRSEYKVTIRTFRNKKPAGFASFRAVWVNESVLKSERPLLFVFHHEYYHIKHNHKFWLLITKFMIAASFLTKYFINWWICIVIVLVIAYISSRVKDVFEEKANEYAKKKVYG